MSKLLFIGCGKMGGALLRGLIGQKGNDEIIVVKPSPLGPSKSANNVAWVASPDKIDPAFIPDAVIIAIKPQKMAELLPLYQKYKESVFLSIAAGQTIARIALTLDNPRAAIVRAMPNLPASIGKGISVAVANGFVAEPLRTLCTRLLEAAGEVAWVEDEKLIDPVTALSGSGPAYVFALTEAMEAAGITLGLAPALARKLARATVVGSGALLDQANETATELREAVTSPHGTTQAALEKLLATDGLFPLLERAMKAASDRAAELSA